MLLYRVGLDCLSPEAPKGQAWHSFTMTAWVPIIVFGEAGKPKLQGCRSRQAGRQPHNGVAAKSDTLAAVNTATSAGQVPQA